MMKKNKQEQKLEQEKEIKAFSPEAESTEKNSSPLADDAVTKTDSTDESSKAILSESEQNIEKTEEKSQDPLIIAQQEAEAWKDKYVRLLAEFENYKKRMRQERTEWYKSAIAEIMIKLLPILDDFERGLKNMQQTNETQLEVFKSGYELIYNKLLTTLKQYGLEPIDELTDFNTDIHEAIQMVEDSERKGKVIEIVEKGYKLDGKVIRFAKVVVAN